MLMMPVGVGGKYTSYVFDETKKIVFVLDPKVYNDKSMDQENQMKMHLMKINRMSGNIRLA